MRCLSLSFSGCAWLLPFHLGVIEILNSENLLDSAEVLGASSGALAATVAVLGLDPQEIMKPLMAIAEKTQQNRFGPAGHMSAFIHEALWKILPEDVHQKLNHRLKVSITVLPSFRNQIINASVCGSKLELIELLMASGYIPLYCEKPARWRGRLVVDGSFSNIQPRSSSQTWTVSPFGDADISPRVPLETKGLLQPTPEKILDFYAIGREAAVHFLRHKSIKLFPSAKAFWSPAEHFIQLWPT